MNKYRIVFILQFVFLSFACVNTVEIPQVYYSVRGLTQGTSYLITYKADKGVELNKQIDSLLHAFDLSLSSYDSTSIISRINQGQENIKPDEMFIKVFNISKEIHQKTNGAFDITVASIVNAWGFGTTGDSKGVVSNEVIDSLLQFTGMDKIDIIDGKIVKKDPRVSLNVNAIAQGYSADVVADFFESLGLSNYLIEIGGEVRTKGINAKGLEWRIGVDKPLDGNNMPGRNMQTVLKISGRSLATSGNYRKFFVENGVKYAHSINPKTGYPAQHNLLSTTIIAKECIYADAYATACMVIGIEEAIKLIEATPDVEAYLIYNDEDGNYKVYSTKGIEKFIVHPF